MGVEHYLYNEELRVALDVHKSYWLIDVEDWGNCTPADIRALIPDMAEDGGTRAGCPAHAEAVARWIEEHGGGCVKIGTDAAVVDQMWAEHAGREYWVKPGWKVWGTHEPGWMNGEKHWPWLPADVDGTP